MSEQNKSHESADWTHLLADPDLVSHLGRLLQTYRDAPPDGREDALLAAMREIKKEAAGKKRQPVASSPMTTEAPPKPQITAAAAASASASGDTNQKAQPTAFNEQAVSKNEAVASEQKVSKPAAVAPPPLPVPHPGPTPPPFEPDIFTPTWGQDRRKFPRMKCFVAVEIHVKGSATPIWGNLSNTSLGGCFVESVTPVKPGSDVEIGLWVASGQIWVKGLVLNGIVTRTASSFGIRIKFEGLDPAPRESLRQFLRYVENTTKSYEHQNSYLAQLKR